MISNSTTDFVAEETIGWGELNSLPSVLQFEVVVVVPADSTLDEQRRLLEILKGDLSIQSGVSTKIVWIINRFCLPDIGLLVSSSPLVALRAISSGKIVSYLPNVRIDLRDVAFAFSGLGKSAGVTARWIDRGLVSAPIGAITPDDQWLLTPSASGLDGGAVNFSAFRSIQLLIWALIIFVFTAAILAGVRVAAVGRISYIRGVSWVAVQDPIDSNFIPSWHRAAFQTWKGADARMTDRVIYDNYRSLQYVSQNLNVTERSYEVWSKLGEVDKAENSITFYYLALLSGDTESAFQIATSGGPKDEYSWMTALSTTFWQASVESLHELNLDRARSYNALFLSTSLRPMEGIYRGEWSMDFQRNRTLAWILSREFQQRRIYSLCSRPGVTGSFGRLIEPSIPIELSGLEQRRSFFRESVCSASTRIAPKVDYNQLSALEELVELESNQQMTTPMQNICSVAPLECRYILLRKALRLTFASDQSVINEALSFATDCSYLSDDMIFDVFREAEAASDSGVPTITSIDLLSVQEALRCARRFGLDGRSDYEDFAADLDCNWFTVSSAVSPDDLGPFAEILARCNHE